MGYSTRYRLEVTGADHDDVTTELEDIAGYDPLEEANSWYEHDEDMQKLAKRFPQAVLTLHGEGEEQGDVWRKVYKHGQKPVEQRPTSAWPEPPEWARK